VLCPNCNSSDLKKVSLIYAAGVYESRGRITGFFVGNSDGLLLGKYRGKNQSRLSTMVNPPRKLPYAAPIIFWLVGFFPVMAFVGLGKLSLTTGLLGVTYVLLLHVLPAGALVYNFFVYPKKYKRWEGMFMCQRCGALIGPQNAAHADADRRVHVELAGNLRGKKAGEV